MKMYWWQHGLHIEPESKEEMQKLVVFADVLDGVRVYHQVPSGPVGGVKTGNKQTVPV